MIQYGDITTLSGHDLAPVDLIVGGSPCQDLSVAGKRAGLDGERSGLFMEMIRIIREMREATHGICPRFALWENVPGAFSSNEGRDFSVVLGEFSRLIEPKAPDVPVPQTGWTKSGVLLVGDGQIAWRTHDAQYWGVPQRRKRIALVADLRGQSAAEILFERKGMPGDFEQSETQREDSAESIGADFKSPNDEPLMIEMQSTKNTIIEDGISPTMTARQFPGGNQVNAVMIKADSAPVSNGNGQLNQITMSDKANALDTMHDQQAIMQFQSFGVYSESFTAGTLKAKNDGQSNSDLVVKDAIRRLTPMECERLQGYPDGWTDIPGASDSARYKAIGNSIALPFWEHLAKRFAQYGKVQTIGSLFDGIGGFPLCFKRAGCETFWTSEIEPFCQKVVAYHTERGDL